jgi:hypothetical protein
MSNDTTLNDKMSNDKTRKCGTTTLSITTLSIKGLYVTLSVSDSQHNNALPIFWVSRFIYYYAECHYTKCHYAACRRAEIVKCQFATIVSQTMIVIVFLTIRSKTLYYHFLKIKTSLMTFSVLPSITLYLYRTLYPRQEVDIVTC